MRLIDAQVPREVARTGLEHGGVPSLGPDKGFEIRALREVEDIDEQAKIEFRTKAGKIILVSLHDLCRDRIDASPGPRMARRFFDEVNRCGLSVLDIGGRARSRVDGRQQVSTADYVVPDILPGGNVDVVGDADELARLFPAERFDAFLSVAVFEHLLMPWAVVAQINRVLKTGGIGLISTHQTLGMHDLPWDFWRFSDTAWDGFFNRLTVFDIVDRALDFEQQILPFV